MSIRVLCSCFGILATLTAAGCDSSQGPSQGSTAQPAPGAVAAPGTPGRAVSADAEAAMKAALAAESTPKKAWIYSQPGNPEVAAVVGALQGVFKGAGWDVAAETANGISLKAGVVTLIAEEQYPPYVDTVLKALEASGLNAKSAAGYRAYFDEMKGKNPAWPGVPIRADQDFVIVVGPKPAA